MNGTNRRKRRKRKRKNEIVPKRIVQSIQLGTYNADKVNRGMGRRTALPSPSGQQRILNDLVRLDLVSEYVSCTLSGQPRRSSTLNGIVNDDFLPWKVFDRLFAIPFGQGDLVRN